MNPGAVPPPGRKQFGAFLSDEAYERLYRFARGNGASMTTFLEALALSLDPDANPPRWAESVLKAARALELERARRSKR